MPQYPSRVAVFIGQFVTLAGVAGALVFDI